MDLPIYMDNQATTRVDPRVVAAMLPFFTDSYGNAASASHGFGRTARAAVDEARAQVAAVLGADPEEILFTSGATEANNLAIKGVAAACREKGNHIVTSVVEHESVLEACRRLEGYGFQVTYLPVDRDGLVRVEDVRAALTDRTILVTLMAANNVIGVLNPVEEIGRLCHERGVLFHTDATQAFGKVPLDVNSLRVDLLACSAHKFHGPKGVGALYVRRRGPRVRLVPQLDGGGQERGQRSGTLNVPGIVGMGEAARLCQDGLAEEAARVTGLRERLRAGIMGRLEGVVVNGHPTQRIPGNLNLSFAGVTGEALLAGHGDVALSSGSACTSHSLEPSYVLLALGLEHALADASLRYGLGRFSTEAEVDYVIDRTAAVVRELRERAPEEAAVGVGSGAER